VGAPAVEFPQLDWHERPSWEDKLYFASQRSGASRRRSADRAFKITPPGMEINDGAGG
jgi:hypothetical protein